MLNFIQIIGYVIIFSLFSSDLFAQNLKEISESSKWRYILHYKNNATLSTVEKGSHFFLSEIGHEDPYSELLETLKVFKNPKQYLRLKRGHPQCLYPARFSFLKSLGLLEVKEVNCLGLREWISELGFDEIFIVHASQFISNPASVMGHTFIKVLNNKSVNFLNFYIGYAAAMNDDVSVVDYVRKGLLGGFNGVFSQGPYYEKVHEYNQIEKRDIWEYKLELSNAEKLEFSYLLWEGIYNINQNYFFMDENCSYMSVAILQAIFPDKNLISDLSLYVVPHETIKTLEKNDLIADAQFRPSIRKTLRERYKNLSSEQQDNVLKIISSKKIEMVDVEVADTVLDYISLKKHNNMGKVEEELKVLNNKLLVARSLMGSSRFPVVESSNPLDSHGEYHVESGFLNSKDKFALLGFRPGIHNLMDKGAAFLENSSFSFFEIFLTVSEDKISLYNFNIFKIMNNIPTSDIDPTWSWGAELSVSKDIESPCFDCQRVELSSVLGKEYYLNRDIFLHIYTALDIHSPKDIGQDFFLMGGELGLGYLLQDKAKFYISGKYLWDIYRDSSTSYLWNSRLRIYNLTKSIDMNFEYTHVTNHSDLIKKNQYSFLSSFIINI